MARFEVAAHALGAHDESVHQPREALEHVVEREERIGDDDPLRRRVRDVALVPERDVLQADERVAPHDACEPADALGDDRVALVRHRRGALLSLPERLLYLGHLGAREMAHLECELVERRRGDRERGEQLRVPVALEDLRRGGSRLQAESLAGDALEIGIGRRVCADGARELADAHAVERARDTGACAVELEGPAGELDAEGRRLGVHAVRATHLEGFAVLLGPRRHDGQRAVEPGDDEGAGLADLQRERRVDDVGGGEAVVEPAAFLAQPLGHGVDERRRVVVERRLDLRHALRRRPLRVLLQRLGRLGGNDAELGPGRGGGELDLEPGLEPALVRPDSGHGRAGVAGNHLTQSRAARGCSGGRANPSFWGSVGVRKRRYFPPSSCALKAIETSFSSVEPRSRPSLPAPSSASPRRTGSAHTAPWSSLRPPSGSRRGSSRRSRSRSP
jgi:hypothetical protein